MRKINKLIVHCSATPNDREVSVEEIRSWHKQRGWSDIGYHYVIYRNGEIHTGRPVEKTGAHCKGQNADSIGVCLIGNYEFENLQFKALNNLNRMLQGVFGKLEVFGHRDFTDKKTCPNFEVKEVIKC